MSIFKTYARSMWDHGLPVIPLRSLMKSITETEGGFDQRLVQMVQGAHSRQR